MRLDSFSNGFLWLGVVLGALSSVKALNSFLDFGFKGIWADVIEFYSRITQPLRELISKIPFLVEAPDWLPDVLILYTVLVMAGLRSTVLPFRFNGYYEMNNTRRTYDAKVQRKDEEDIKEFWERQTEFKKEELVSVSVSARDGFFVVTLREIVPKWEVVARQSLKCMTLLPVISLEPFRKMNHSIGFVRNAMKDAAPDDAVITFDNEYGKGAYTRWALEVDKVRIDGIFQIVSLPVLVILFLLGATYIS